MDDYSFSEKNLTKMARGSLFYGDLHSKTLSEKLYKIIAETQIENERTGLDQNSACLAEYKAPRVAKLNCRTGGDSNCVAVSVCSAAVKTN